MRTMNNIKELLKEQIKLQTVILISTAEKDNPQNIIYKANAIQRFCGR